MKKVLFFIFVFSFWVLSCEKKPSANIQYKNIVALSEENKKGDVQFSITYPQFEQYPKLNAKIKQVAQDTEARCAKLKADIAEFRKEYADDESDAPNTDDWTVSLGYEESPTVGRNYISVVFYESSYEGGAHGYVAATTVNYDYVTDKVVTIADVLSPLNENWLQLLWEYVREDLTKRSENTDAENSLGTDPGWIETGAGLDQDNYGVFTVNDNSITFIFNPYQVACYADGQVLVDVPFTVFE